MNLKLRLFYTRFTLEDSNGSRYKRIKCQLDFPSDVSPEAAKAELEHKYGKSTDSSLWDGKVGCQIAPHSFIEINSHSIVDVDRKPEPIGLAEKSWEVPLFPGKVLNDCLMDSPNIGLKRRKRK